MQVKMPEAYQQLGGLACYSCEEASGLLQKRCKQKIIVVVKTYTWHRKQYVGWVTMRKQWTVTSHTIGKQQIATYFHLQQTTLKCETGDLFIRRCQFSFLVCQLLVSRRTSDLNARQSWRTVLKCSVVTWFIAFNVRQLGIDCEDGCLNDKRLIRELWQAFNQPRVSTCLSHAVTRLCQMTSAEQLSRACDCRKKLVSWLRQIWIATTVFTTNVIEWLITELAATFHYITNELQYVKMQHVHSMPKSTAVTIYLFGAGLNG